MAEYDIQTCSSVWFQTWQVHMECLWPQFLIPKTSQDYSATMCPTLSNSIKFFNELSKLGLKKYGPKPTSAIFFAAISNLRIFESPQPHGKNMEKLELKLANPPSWFPKHRRRQWSGWTGTTCVPEIQWHFPTPGGKTSGISFWLFTGKSSFLYSFMIYKWFLIIWLWASLPSGITLKG